MRRSSVFFTVVFLLLALSSCAKKSTVETAEKRHATVVLQDGTTVAGAVVASSASEITLAGDDSITRTIPMTQVKSVEYHDVPAAQPQAPAAGAPQTASSAQAPSDVPTGQSAPSAAPAAKVYELPEGTEISVRTNETIDSRTASEGQSYSADVTKAVMEAPGKVAIPRGSSARLAIVSASKGGRIRGASDLVLTLTSVTVGGRRYTVDTGNVERRGKSGVGANKRTATYTGGGAALGAIIGAIAGGGRGAAIGAGAGAGAGALTQIATKGKAVRVPAETVLTFRLDAPLRITAE